MNNQPYQFDDDDPLLTQEFRTDSVDFLTPTSEKHSQWVIDHNTCTVPPSVDQVEEVLAFNINVDDFYEGSSKTFGDIKNRKEKEGKMRVELLQVFLHVISLLIKRAASITSADLSKGAPIQVFLEMVLSRENSDITEFTDYTFWVLIRDPSLMSECNVFLSEMIQNNRRILEEREEDETGFKKNGHRLYKQYRGVSTIEYLTYLADMYARSNARTRHLNDILAVGQLEKEDFNPVAFSHIFSRDRVFANRSMECITSQSVEKKSAYFPVVDSRHRLETPQEQFAALTISKPDEIVLEAVFGENSADDGAGDSSMDDSSHSEGGTRRAKGRGASVHFRPPLRQYMYRVKLDEVKIPVLWDKLIPSQMVATASKVLQTFPMLGEFVEQKITSTTRHPDDNDEDPPPGAISNLQQFVAHQKARDREVSQYNDMELAREERLMEETREQQERLKIVRRRTKLIKKMNAKQCIPIVNDSEAGGAYGQVQRQAAIVRQATDQKEEEMDRGPLIDAISNIAQEGRVLMESAQSYFVDREHELALKKQAFANESVHGVQLIQFLSKIVDYYEMEEEYLPVVQIFEMAKKSIGSDAADLDDEIEDLEEFMGSLMPLFSNEREREAFGELLLLCTETVSPHAVTRTMQLGIQSWLVRRYGMDAYQNNSEVSWACRAINKYREQTELYNTSKLQRFDLDFANLSFYGNIQAQQMLEALNTFLVDHNNIEPFLCTRRALLDVYRSEMNQKWHQLFQSDCGATGKSYIFHLLVNDEDPEHSILIPGTSTVITNVSSASFNVDDRLGMNSDRVIIMHEVALKILVGGSSDEARNEISGTIKDAITSGKIKFKVFVPMKNGKRACRMVECKFGNVFLLAWNYVRSNITHSMASRLFVFNFPESTMQLAGLKLAEELKKINHHSVADLTECIRKYRFIQSMAKDIQKLYATKGLKPPTSTVVYAFCLALEKKLRINRVNIHAHLACMEENIERVFRTKTFSKHGNTKPVGPEDLVIMDRLNFVRVEHVITALAFTYSEIIRPETSLVLKILRKMWLGQFECSYRKIHQEDTRTPPVHGASYYKSGLAPAGGAVMSQQGASQMMTAKAPCDLDYDYALFGKSIVDLAKEVNGHMCDPFDADGKRNQDKVFSEEIIVTILTDLTKRFISAPEYKQIHGCNMESIQGVSASKHSKVAVMTNDYSHMGRRRGRPSGKESFVCVHVQLLLKNESAADTMQRLIEETLDLEAEPPRQVLWIQDPAFPNVRKVMTIGRKSPDSHNSLKLPNMSYQDDDFKSGYMRVRKEFGNLRAEEEEVIDLTGIPLDAFSLEQRNNLLHITSEPIPTKYEKDRRAFMEQRGSGTSAVLNLPDADKGAYFAGEEIVLEEDEMDDSSEEAGDAVGDDFGRKKLLFKNLAEKAPGHEEALVKDLTRHKKKQMRLLRDARRFLANGEHEKYLTTLLKYDDVDFSISNFIVLDPRDGKLKFHGDTFEPPLSVPQYKLVYPLPEYLDDLLMKKDYGTTSAPPRQYPESVRVSKSKLNRSKNMNTHDQSKNVRKDFRKFMHFQRAVAAPGSGEPARKYNKNDAGGFKPTPETLKLLIATAHQAHASDDGSEDFEEEESL